MNPIRQKIEAVMAGEPRSSFFSLATWLYGASLLYGWATRLRAALYRLGAVNPRRLPCSVISIGNITAGGTGKTPLTIYLAGRLRDRGYRVAVLSRGYKGRCVKAGALVGDGRKIFLDAALAGDEPYMMAATLKNVPVFVGQNRFQSGRRAVNAFAPQVILLDDGFQHLQLARDLNLVLLDHRHPFGNGHLLPRGPLREPVAALARGDALVFTRADDARTPSSGPLPKHWPAHCAHRPVFVSAHRPYLHRIVKAGQANTGRPQTAVDAPGFESFQGLRVVAFSGIAANSDFYRTVVGCGCEVQVFLEFPDHHQYRAADYKRILRALDASQADLLITTEKDYVRLPSRVNWPVDLGVIGIKMDFGQDADGFMDYICRSLKLA